MSSCISSGDSGLLVSPLVVSRDWSAGSDVYQSGPFINCSLSALNLVFNSHYYCLDSLFYSQMQNIILWCTFPVFIFLILFFNIFYWLCYYSCTIFPPFIPHSPLPCTAPPIHIPPPSTFSSCPLIVHISSLASTFPILFLPSRCLFPTYHLCYLFSVPFSPFSLFPSPADNPPCDLHFSDSVPFLVVSLVCFYFYFL